MNEREFYITLSSDSSLQIYPDNKASHFRNLLPREINLQEDWIVGLCQIQFPNSFLHFKEFEASIQLIHHTEGRPRLTTIHRFEYGVYPNVETIIDMINDQPGLNEHFNFIYNRMTGFVIIRRICRSDNCRGNNHMLILTPKLSTVLGFRNRWENVEFSENEQMRGDIPVSLCRALPTKLFAHTDICRPHIIGDMWAPLLRVVPYDNANYVFGSYFHRSFDPYYFPLIHSNFQTIEIDITDKNSSSLPFAYGPSMVTLHFKRSD